MSKKIQILDIYFQPNANYTIRREQLNGVDHIVVPVIMMVEGVHSGSHGPILHLANDLGRYPESWDGIPVTIGHPIVGGQYVSANSPAVLQDWAVGRIFNTQIIESALRAEAWLDEVTLERVSETTLERINNGEVIEVSIGIFSDEEMVAGTWNNERYVAIARNHRPNHLALLPDEVGACSIEDGCGIRVNKQEKLIDVTNEEMVVNTENQTDVDNSTITNGKVKAERLIKKNTSMCTECVKRLADGLINNKSLAWSESDREFLEGQTEETLEKMTPPVVEKEEVQTNAAPKLTREDILAVFSANPMTDDEFLKLASPEVRLSIQEGLELRTNQKNNLILQILANTEEWPEDELKLKETSELKKIHKLATKDLGETVYVGAGGAGGTTKVKTNGSSGPKTTPMLPFGVTIKGK